VHVGESRKGRDVCEDLAHEHEVHVRQRLRGELDRVAIDAVAERPEVPDARPRDRREVRRLRRRVGERRREVRDVDRVRQVLDVRAPVAQGLVDLPRDAEDRVRRVEEQPVAAPDLLASGQVAVGVVLVGVVVDEPVPRQPLHDLGVGRHRREDERPLEP